MGGRDAGLIQVLERVTAAQVARRLSISRQSVHGWRRVPRAHLVAVAALAGLAPETVRPDLADWIARDGTERRRAAALARFSLAPASVAVGAAGLPPPVDRSTRGLLDCGVVAQAMQFAARERGMPVSAVWAGGSRAAQAARAYAVGLATVVGRVASPVISEMLGFSRQNVENAAARYLRARDGDDADDIEGAGPSGHAVVIERGRLRRAKSGDVALWEAERRFAALLAPASIDRRRRA